VKLEPRQTVNKYCTDCLGMTQRNTKEISACEGNRAANGACPLYPVRVSGRVTLRIMRAYCIYCMGGNKVMVKECTTTACGLWHYRLGRNPSLTGLRKGGDHLVMHRFKSQNQR
jgi:hypothetical protein